jgi:hypothetical protein
VIKRRIVTEREIKSCLAQNKSSETELIQSKVQLMKPDIRAML